MRVFITGIAGFIGYHVAQALHAKNIEISGIDNFNPYYDPKLKYTRAAHLKEKGVEITSQDICEPNLKKQISEFNPTHILHLAAQAGVRYSLTNPQAYVSANLEGFSRILEIVRENPQIQLVYASSSSVYGLNTSLPYSVKDRTDSQASFYGVTKKANELMAANYQHLFGIRAIGLRYFTVYGPWGRPDMALFSFTRAILAKEPIDLYNYGNMQRDFTYIDDIVKGTISALNYTGNISLFNLGNNAPITLLEFVDILEEALHTKAVRRLMPMQPGDVMKTFADIQESSQALAFNPTTSVREGIKKFVHWYLNYYKNRK